MKTVICSLDLHVLASPVCVVLPNFKKQYHGSSIFTILCSIILC